MDEFKELMIMVSFGHAEERELEKIKIIVGIITNKKIKDKHKIESTFDRILNIEFLPEEDLKPIYYKLLDYYRKINKNSAMDYEETFKKKFSDFKIL